MKIDPERAFKKACVEDFKQVFGKGKLVNSEICLLGVYDVLKKQTYGSDFKKGGIAIIGRADLHFFYGSYEYLGEVKYTSFTNYDFWNSLKIIGYVEYFKWQREKGEIHPAILIPINKVKLEHTMIADKLKIALFGIEKTKDRFSAKLLNPKS